MLNPESQIGDEYAYQQTQQNENSNENETIEKINSQQLGEFIKKRVSEAAKGKFIKLADGEEIVLTFDPENIDKVTRPNKFKNNELTTRIRFHVKDTDNDERLFETSQMTADMLNTYISKGKLKLLVQRKGNDQNTRYFAFTAE